MLRLLAHRLQRDPLKFAAQLPREFLDAHLARRLDAAAEVAVLGGDR